MSHRHPVGKALPDLTASTKVTAVRRICTRRRKTRPTFLLSCFCPSLTGYKDNNCWMSLPLYGGSIQLREGSHYRPPNGVIYQRKGTTRHR